MRQCRRLALDVETTGVNNRLAPEQGGDELIALSIVNEDCEVLFDALFRPMFHSSWPDAMRVHGIAPKQVVECSPFADYVDAVQEVVAFADELIVYNARFDLAFLMHEGICFDGVVIVDTMLDFSAVYAEYDGYHQNARWQKLEKALLCMDIVREGRAHSSVSDARAAMQVQRKLDSGWVREGHVPRKADAVALAQRRARRREAALQRGYEL